MRTFLLFLLSLPAFANSIPITTFQLSGIQSTLQPESLKSSDPTQNVSYTMFASNHNGSESIFTYGQFNFNDGNVDVGGTLGNSSISNGIFTGEFTGEETRRTGPDSWAQWSVTGTLTETVTSLGTGSIVLSSEVPDGGFSPVPEPSTLILMGLGLLGCAYRCRRSRQSPTGSRIGG